MARRWLAGNLKKQGRLMEAEFEARQAVKDSLARGGKGSNQTGSSLEVLGDVLIAQGRLHDASRLLETSLKILQKGGLSEDSQKIAGARIAWGRSLAAAGDYKAAMEQFSRARRGLEENRFIYSSWFEHDHQVIFCHLMTGQLDEAARLIDKAYGQLAGGLGATSYRVAELLAFRGMVNAARGQIALSYDAFSKSVPTLLGRDERRADFVAGERLRHILASYLDVLSRIHGTTLEKELGLRAEEEAFKIAEALSASTVQAALGASMARAAVVDPELTELVRREQDAFKQIQTMEAVVIDLLGLPEKEEGRKLSELQTAVASLKGARATLITEIRTRFPKYADFANPQPVGFDAVQQHLERQEALLVIYPSDQRTYVWAVPARGIIRFSVAPVGTGYLRENVAKLRKALAPDVQKLGDIPEFDLTQAYDIYRRLLEPVQEGWKDAEELLVVASGPLGQLPFSLLPTALVTLSQKESILFDDYRKVPWLVRKIAITHLPSASAVVTLRSLPRGDLGRKTFVGFGDPYFNREQASEAEKKGGTLTALADRDGRCQIRSVRVTPKGDLDSKIITSIDITRLSRLPDTADEVLSIAGAVGADPKQDVFLGARASERIVKSMDLSDRQIVVFASHGLVPGDLDGLDQPALALSAPSVTGESEDGLLTPQEIVKLRLNADWVVLSACNTGAAEGAGAEAISGLGRAFFYAGTRAILVTMWPVESTSATKLTTGLFHYQRENASLSRSRSLQKSMLNLIDHEFFKEDTGGQKVASYAHPIFWAPFIVVGDGR